MILKLPSTIIGSKTKLRGKRLADAQKDYIWYTDPELVRLFDTPLLTVSFSKYLSNYTGELRYPDLTRYRFAIETTDGDHIGNCLYYNIDEINGAAELGIMIGNRDYWDKGCGTDAVITLVNYIFHQTKLKRIYLRTLYSNKRAQKCFQKCGFTPYGRLHKDSYSFMCMEIHREQWEKQQPETVKRG